MADATTTLQVGDRVEIKQNAPFGAGTGVIVDRARAYDFWVERDDLQSGATPDDDKRVAYDEHELRKA